MPYNWLAVQHEATREPFEFERNGETWRLPHQEDLVIGARIGLQTGLGVVQVARQHGERLDAETGEWVKDGETCAAMFLESYADDIAAWLAAYEAHTGISVGESSASSS